MIRLPTALITQSAARHSMQTPAQPFSFTDQGQLRCNGVDGVGGVGRVDEWLEAVKNMAQWVRLVAEEF